MSELKSEIYKGRTIHFNKKYKYISSSYPSTPYVEAFQSNKGTIVNGFTKAEAFENAKRNINSIERKRYELESTNKGKRRWH